MEGPSGGSRQNIWLLTVTYRNRGGRFGAPKPPERRYGQRPPVSRLERARTSKAPGFAGGYKPRLRRLAAGKLVLQSPEAGWFPAVASVLVKLDNVSGAAATDVDAPALAVLTGVDTVPEIGSAHV